MQAARTEWVSPDPGPEAGAEVEAEQQAALVPGRPAQSSATEAGKPKKEFSVSANSGAPMLHS